MSAPPVSEETTLKSRDGLPLFVRVTRPLASEKGVVIVTHGMGEHSGRYPHLLSHLATHGYRAIAYDLRGHGRSGGARGYLARYEDFLDDLELVLNAAGNGAPRLYLYGHSLGGQIVVNFLTRNALRISGAIIASPWLRLAFRPPPWKVFLARIASALWPRFTQTAPLLDAHLSRDLEWIAALDDSRLTHRRVSAAMYSNLIRGARSALRSATLIKLPLLLMHGDADPVTCIRASRAWFERASAGDKTLLVWPGMRHEVHNELGRELVLRAISDWLDAHPTNAAPRLMAQS